MKRLLFPLVSIGVVLSCATGGPPTDTDVASAPPPSPQASVSETEIGLAPGTAFEQPSQAPIAFPTMSFRRQYRTRSKTSRPSL
jgi:hypothetical protein